MTENFGPKSTWSPRAADFAPISPKENAHVAHREVLRTAGPVAIPLAAASCAEEHLHGRGRDRIRGRGSPREGGAPVECT